MSDNDNLKFASQHDKPTSYFFLYFVNRFRFRRLAWSVTRQCSPIIVITDLLLITDNHPSRKDTLFNFFYQQREKEKLTSKFGSFGCAPNGWACSCWTRRFRMNWRMMFRNGGCLMGWNSRWQKCLWQKKAHSMMGPPSSPVTTVHQTSTHFYPTKLIIINWRNYFF